jgi:hypothetical protein
LTPFCIARATRAAFSPIRREPSSSRAIARHETPAAVIVPVTPLSWR